MEKQFNDIDQIERFLEGSMDEKELTVFNERLKADAAFAETLAMRKLLQASYIEASKRNKLRNQIHSVLTIEKRNSIKHRKVWIAAASVIILAGIGAFLLLQSRQIQNNNIALQQDFIPKDAVVSGKKNSINVYGSIDTFGKQHVSKATAFLPNEGAVFNQTDTILFYQQEIKANDILIITNKAGSVVKKINKQGGSSAYKILPHTLEPAIYTWYFSLSKGAQHSFLIK
ncbi:MAG: hypothetical protein WCR72_04785 [Bacteroidota bacterium]